MNNFEELDNEFDLERLGRGGVIETLIGLGLENLTPLALLLFPFLDGRLLKGRNAASENFERQLALPISEQSFIEGFLDKYYGVTVEGDFEIFMERFRSNTDANDKIFTVFAPSNEAMEKLNLRVESFDSLTYDEKISVVTKFALSHISSGERELYFDDLQCDTKLKTFGEETKTVCEDDGRKFQVGKGNRAGDPRPEIKNGDLTDTRASNGVIQVLNVVVIEPEDIKP